ncbi:unnamed protein product [Rhizophagus irregularis]|uniref:Uncharacterized protein n=1 Tax=Rhizophagus irregularis TaxID=588596 RepID=A0A915ZCC5_9GLOM|nr:unnamed protein product [Rhizophagus irregularis]
MGSGRALHGGDLRAGARLALGARLQDRADRRTGGGLCAVEVHRHKGRVGNRAAPPRGRHPRPDRAVVAGAGRLRDHPGTLERRRAVPQWRAAWHDLGAGLWFHGGAARIRGACLDAVRELHPVVGCGQIGRHLADAKRACRPFLDARRDRPVVHAAAVRFGLGAERAAAAQRARRSGAHQTRTDDRGRTPQLPKSLCAGADRDRRRLCPAHRLS